jgi:hypothetical protein
MTALAGDGVFWPLDPTYPTYVVAGGRWIRVKEPARPAAKSADHDAAVTAAKED